MTLKPEGTTSIIKNTCSPLDGHRCVVRGTTSVEYGTVFYIIFVPDWEIMDMKYSHMQLIDSCLEFE